MAAYRTISTLGNILKTKYEARIREQLNNDNVLLKLLKRNAGTMDPQSYRSYLTVHAARNKSVSSISEMGTLPTASYQGYQRPYVDMKYTYATLMLSDVAIEATESNVASMAKLLSSEMEGVRTDMSFHIARQFYGIGTGEICKINGTSGAATSLTVDSFMTGAENALEHEELEGSTDGGTTADGRYVYIGTDYAQIESVDTATTLTIESSTTVADNDIIYLAGTSSASNSKDNEMMGLRGIVDDGTELATFEGLARSSYNWWKSHVEAPTTASTNQSITRADLTAVYTGAAKYGKPNLMVTSFELFQAIGNMLTDDRRYTTSMNVPGGFLNLSWNGIPVVPDRNCQYNFLYVLNTDSLSIEELTPVSWMDRDGSVLYRDTNSTASYAATLRYYANLACDNCRKNGVLTYRNA